MRTGFAERMSGTQGVVNLPNRRQVVAGLSATVAALSAPTVGHARSSKPNIVFILADDLGYADIGCFGSRAATTPNIDALARSGLRLTDSYANACVCSPTRLALITGRYQHRYPAGLKEPIATGHVGIPANVTTLPGLLRKRGYRTSLVGKWHLGEPPEFGPLARGYERFYGIYKGGADYFSHLAGRPPGTATDGLFDGKIRSADRGYLTDLLAERAVAEIRAAAQDRVPLFLSLHFTAPHWPWEGPMDEDVSQALTDLQHLGGGSLATFRQMVESLDAGVGAVIRELERTGLCDNTLVVFTSDNGGERFSDVWPLLGRKGELLEGGIRVPTIVSWPSRIRTDAASRQVAMSMDWLPTLAALAGAPVRTGASDGMNLLPVLLDETGPIARTVFWRHHAHDQAAVRADRWKYLRIADEEHLFDLSQEPNERADLKARNPDTLARLRESFLFWNKGMLPYSADDFSYDAKQAATDRY